MHLTSLTIRGFKSFASATTFTFDRGMSAIVGPNGSGKSNVVDALSWVLGEQGTKNLRGGSMQDVIFAGAGQRSALGRAKVSVTFDNSDGELDAPYSEVEISRTMFRTGGSEYEINGEPARLADIQELLSGAGLGKNLHVLVGQGQLDQLLYASAEQRRVLLEEAAGINRHRRRQDKTARKLESMRENLTRVEDLVKELEHQLEPLGEQAESAREASKIQAEIRELQSVQLAVDIKNLSQDIEKISEQQAQAHEAFEQLTAEDKTAQENSGVFRKTFSEAQEIERSIENRLQKISALESQIAGLIDLAHERSTRSEIDVTPYQRALASARARVNQAQQDASDLSAHKVLVAEQVFVAGIKQQVAAEDYDKASQAVRSVHKQIQAERQRKAELTEELAAHRARATRAEAEAQERGQELDEIIELKSNATAILQEHRSDLQDAENKVRQTQEQHESVQKRRSSARQNLERARTEHAKITTLEATHIAEKATLHRALASKTSQDAPAKAQQLFKRFSVEDGWDEAVAVALGDIAEAYVVERQTVRTAGKVTEVSVVFSPSAHSSLPDCAEKNVRPILEVIDADADAEPIVRAALGYYVVTENIEDAHSFVEKNTGFVAVTRAGVRISNWSVIYPRATSSAVQLQHDFEKVSQQLENIQRRMLESSETVQAAEKTLADARTEEKEVLRHLGAARGEAEKLHRETAAFESRLATLESHIKRQSHLVETAQQRVKDAQRELKTTLDLIGQQRPVDRDISALEKRQTQVQQRVSRVQSVLDAATSRAQASEESLTRAKKGLQTSNQELNQALDEFNRALQRQELGEQRAHKARVAKKKAILLQQALKTAHKHEEDALVHAQKKLADLAKQQERKTSEKTIRQAQLSSLSTQVSECKIQHARLETRYEDLSQKSLEISGKTASQLVERYEEHLENYDSDQTLLTLEKLTQQLQNLGAVNPLALEEYEALQERHRFMNEQLNDLKSSRADLRAIMKDVNTHIATLFESVFTEVKNNYEVIFPRLFPGGEGTLVLTDPTNLLDTGIEVHARPAGKKVKRLSLLSGGERSLASLALLIAIFMARPAPFYVLDEVEAALDDRNLSRLLDILKELSQQSQLVMVTHKTRTMEAAEVLYGIAMHDGVSTVVSQRIEQLRELLA